MNSLADLKSENLRLKSKVLLNKPQEFVPAECLNWATYNVADVVKNSTDWEAEQQNFVDSEPSYQPSRDGAELIARFLLANDLLPSVECLSYAYHFLLDAGLFVEVVDEPEPVASEKPKFRDTEERESVYEAGVGGFDEQGDEKVYSYLEVEHMTAQEYQHKIMGLRRVAKIFGASGR